LKLPTTAFKRNAKCCSERPASPSAKPTGSRDARITVRDAHRQ
jgi:hypothetical protein